MAKKIIIGLVITIVISLTSFGAIYAYQKEKVNLEKINAKEYGINYSSNGNHSGECSESTNGNAELECLKNEERIRENFRYRKEDCEKYNQAETYRNEYHHRYENEYNEDCDQDCKRNEKSIQNKNGNNNNQNRGKNNR